MSTTIEFETIGSRLQSLEVALQAQNESHEQIVLSNATPKAAAAVVNAVNAVNANSPSPTRPNAVGVGNINVGTALPPALPSGVFAQPPRSMRPTPNLPISEVGTVRNRHMVLQLTKHAHPSETETDKKLKMIMGQTGKLNINGRQYPTDINDLRHLGDLGNGTSGNVVKMLHLSSNTIIAVKQMRRTGNAEENKRILMDLDVVLKSHDCKYIVKCLGCFVRDPDVWICMELMSMCFDKLLKLTKKPVPEPILGKVTVATVNALAYLKDKHGVIHRDVKPSNILIDERGNIKLCDFGISGRLVDSKANTRSAGCAAYMAPERIDPKKPKYDIRADVWSLGITLVELATARSPYEGCNTDFEVLTKVLDSEPPCLPRGEGFNFSQQFHDFVIKCLTKNHQDRPKYPELLAQPFIKIYELADVDVPSWFQMVMDSAAGRRMRANGDSTLTRTNAAKFGRTTTTTTARSPTTAATPTAAAAATKTIRPTQIPSYQQQQPPQSPASQYFMQSAIQLPQQQQATAIHTTTTAAAATISTAAATVETTTTTNVSYLSSGGSSSNSASPLSPPAAIISNDIGKLYRKSPFMQRKLSNGSQYNNKYNDESPKRESVLSSIGQSILRNLTTSPFSQKKHHAMVTATTPTTTTTTLPQYKSKLATPTEHITPSWRLPATTTTAAAAAATPEHSLMPFVDTCDSNNSNVNALSLPKQLIADNALLQLNNQQQQQQQQQRLQPGNQSPIVLQRFYHQQNQLREKEAAERQQQQQQQHHYQQQQQQQQHYNYQAQLPRSPAATSTNPFHSNYVAPSSSHSTSSQSSTQSNCSQIATAAAATNVCTAAPAAAAGHFGIGNAAQLQYQPLPTATTAATTSPTAAAVTNSNHLPKSPEQQLPAYLVGSKLSKLYARRQLLGQSASNSNEQHQSVYASNAADSATSPTTATTTTSSSLGQELEPALAPQPPPYRSVISNGSSSAGGGKSYYYHRTLSAASSSSSHNTSQSTSPTTEPLTGPGPGLTGGGGGGGTSGFLRRYASSGGSLGLHTSGSISTPPSPHLLAGVDRRHRSPDPPPRYNRGQSPLLLRKNLLELSGQPPGSPLLQRRYVSASPPLPPPRRGSESVPGSPQHFRTRIHYTPEPQRRIYRTIDQ
ncbi:dual specificity mitogen-activated protein kinase kinase hemipterous isoform X2 [Drosophila busckii]|uniref:dual specificity mitogen-activated protein kinase kinase hemipterous isoform X2 n=1 Tax=Drosophila busckii TaxID=30019 RepID=UPI00083F3309|nr:dual specificity mitogen-activated protein kinase kinase hemipterous isoform X2 [Drosophila busckii]